MRNTAPSSKAVLMLQLLLLSTENAVVTEDAFDKAWLRSKAKKTVISCVNNSHLHLHSIHTHTHTHTQERCNVSLHVPDVLRSYMLEETTNDRTVRDGNKIAVSHVVGRRQLADVMG